MMHKVVQQDTERSCSLSGQACARFVNFLAKNIGAHRQHFALIYRYDTFAGHVSFEFLGFRCEIAVPMPSVLAP